MSALDAAPRSRKLHKWLGLLLTGVAVVAVCLVIRTYWGPAPAGAQGGGQGAAAPKAATSKERDVVAVVNGEPIRREELGQDCLRRFGSDVLNSLVNKHLIAQYTKKQGIEVTPQEVDAEIARVAKRFNLPVDQWLQMLEDERGISPEQYANDIIWPTLALRKAAQQAMQVTPEELQAAYETQFGPAVKARLIVCDNERTARQVRAKAAADPAQFGALAKEHSIDTNSASVEGKILPIRKNLGDPLIEQAAFALKEGEVSEVIRVANQYVILLCEERIPSRMKEFPLQGQVKQQLTQAVLDKKEPIVAGKVFDELRKDAKIIQAYNHPENSKRYPGVAAIVNNRTITLQELADECIRRHGLEVLEHTISMVILEQEVRQEGIKVTKGDLDHEIARAAEAMGMIDRKNGNQPDVDAWLDEVEREQGLSVDRYIDDIVWPTVALKKLVLKTVPQEVEVSDEDLQRGYEANYGPRVKCRAIVLNSQRTAQEVWEMARAKPNVVYFGQLANKYSITPDGRLDGEVPPIQKHGGRPLLEKEAFSLKPGEISGIIQVDDKYVILFCEGFTKPENISFEEVREDIYKDLYEKKLRVEMAKKYNAMLEGSRIENYLANTRKLPSKGGPAGAKPPGETPLNAKRPDETRQK
jgi:parvulin-like peptidyl-prolyl isomerase